MWIPNRSNPSARASRNAPRTRGGRVAPPPRAPPDPDPRARGERARVEDVRGEESRPAGEVDLRRTRAVRTRALLTKDRENRKVRVRLEGVVDPRVRIALAARADQAPVVRADPVLDDRVEGRAVSVRELDRADSAHVQHAVPVLQRVHDQIPQALSSAAR